MPNSTPPNKVLLGAGLFALVVALMALFAGCGIPTDDLPRALALDDPTTNTTTSTTTLAASSQTVTAPMFLVKPETEAEREILAKVEREVHDDSARTILEALFTTTNSGESEENLRNLLTGLTFTDLTITEEEDGFTATIDLPKESAELFVDQTRLIAAQIVVTLTNLPPTAEHGPINKVWFKLDGKANLIVDGSGAEISSATRENYAFLDPDSQENSGNEGNNDN